MIRRRRRRWLRVLGLVVDVVGWIGVAWMLEPWKLLQRRRPAPVH